MSLKKVSDFWKLYEDTDRLDEFLEVVRYFLRENWNKFYETVFALAIPLMPALEVYNDVRVYVDWKVEDKVVFPLKDCIWGKDIYGVPFIWKKFPEDIWVHYADFIFEDKIFRTSFDPNYELSEEMLFAETDFDTIDVSDGVYKVDLGFVGNIVLSVASGVGYIKEGEVQAGQWIKIGDKWYLVKEVIDKQVLTLPGIAAKGIVEGKVYETGLFDCLVYVRDKKLYTIKPIDPSPYHISSLNLKLIPVSNLYFFAKTLYYPNRFVSKYITSLTNTTFNDPIKAAAVLKSAWRLFWLGPTKQNLEMAASAIYGGIFSVVGEELVLEIRDQGAYWLVITDKNIYNVPKYLELLISEGDILELMQPIARQAKVYDYVTDGKWWREFGILEGSSSDELYDKYLKWHQWGIRIFV